jgi:spoIIIJ-associated protein
MKNIEVEEKTVDDAINKALEELQASRDQVSVEIIEEGSRGLFGFMGAKPAKVRVSVSQDTTYDTIKEELQSIQQPETLYQGTTPTSHAAHSPTTSNYTTRNQVKPDVSTKPAESEKLQDQENVDYIVTTAKQALSVLLEKLQVEYTVEVKKREDQILFNIHCDNENFLIGRRGTTLDAVQYLVNRIANKNARQKIQVVLDTSDYRVNRKKRLQKLALRLSRRVKMTGKPATVSPMNPHDRRIIHLTLQDDPAVKTMSRGSGFMRRIVISSSKHSGRNNNRKR